MEGPPQLGKAPLEFLAALHGFTLDQMYEARRMLEVGAAGLAAERATGEHMAGMADEVTGMFATLDEPLLIPQLVARLLVDDDLIIDAALRLADRKVLVLQPRVELPATKVTRGRSTRASPRCSRQVLDRYRGPGAALGVAALWVVLVSASPNDAADLVTHLGGEPGEVMLPGDTVARTGFASRTLVLAPDARLRLLALRPDNLSRGALEGVLASCDAVALVRVGSSDDEVQRLQDKTAAPGRLPDPCPVHRRQPVVRIRVRARGEPRALRVRRPADRARRDPRRVRRPDRPHERLHL